MDNPIKEEVESWWYRHRSLAMLSFVVVTMSGIAGVIMKFDDFRVRFVSKPVVAPVPPRADIRLWIEDLIGDTIISEQDMVRVHLQGQIYGCKDKVLTILSRLKDVKTSHIETGQALIGSRSIEKNEWEEGRDAHKFTPTDEPYLLHQVVDVVVSPSEESRKVAIRIIDPEGKELFWDESPLFKVRRP